MAICPHCEKPITLKKGEQNQVCRQTEGAIKKEIMYSCPHCEKVIGFGFFIGGLLPGLLQIIGKAVTGPAQRELDASK